MWLALSLSLLAASEPTCPTREAVDDALTRLGSQGLGARHLNWQPEGQGVWLRLEDAQGAVVAGRWIPSASCDELAAAFAVIAAAWTLELDRAQRPDVSLSRPPPPEAPPPPSAFELGAAGFGLADREGSGFGALLQGASGGDGFAPRFALSIESPRTEPLGPGDIRWQRFALGIGGRYRLRQGAFFEEAWLELDGAALALRGEGYATNASALGTDLGVGAGVRVARVFGAFAPWVGFSGTGWLRSSQIQISGIPDSATLPRIEGALLIGVSWIRP